MIGIRADANEHIASGHIMRCLTIAKQLMKKGENVLFFTADDYALPLLEREGMEAVCLHTDWRDMEGELPVFPAQLEKRGCDRVLVDSYQATAPYLAALRERVLVIYIDDMFDRIYPADLLINYNGYCGRFPYEKAYGPHGPEDAVKGEKRNGTRLLLGTSYVPLREEFAREKPAGEGEKLSREKSTREELTHKENAAGNNGSRAANGPFHILVSCGGGDAFDALTGILSQALRREKLAGAVFHTVVGRFNRNAEKLEAMAKMEPRIRLYHDVSNMAELMEGCDAAVSAAGTVLYELCAMRLPSVFFVCADNQEYDSEFFAKEERMLFAGDIRTGREECIQRICGGLERLMGEKALRDGMRERLGRVTDGRGAERIADEIIRL